jgi:uncharacterized protein YjbI with pentapeptide repeats
MNQNEIKEILTQHKVWLASNRKKGKKADFAGANLKGTILENANLQGANLQGADLYDADLRGANLKGTILEGKQSAKVSDNSSLRAKFDEFAKSLGLKIVSLKVERSETMDL